MNKDWKKDVKLVSKNDLFNYVCKEVKKNGCIGFFSIEEYNAMIRRFNYFWKNIHNSKEVKK